MATTAEMQDRLAKFEVNLSRLDQVVNGSTETVVEVDNGAELPSLARALRKLTTLEGYSFTFDASTADADPGAGMFRINNATYPNANRLFLSNQDANGVSVAAAIGAWDDSTNTIKGQITVVSENDPNIYRVYDVTGATTAVTGYQKVVVTYVAGAGAFTAGEVCSLSFKRAGDKGADGIDSGPVSFYATKAAATAALGTHSNGDVIEILEDESRGELRTRYMVEAGALVFKIYMARDAVNLINATRFGAVPDAPARDNSSGATNSTAAFIAAAQAAVALGQKAITADPGVYHCPGMTALDMDDVWIVGDGIVFTMPSHVYPVETREWASGVTFGRLASTGSRGMIGFEFDDAYDIHWELLPGLFKKYGIVGAIPWPTSASEKTWIREMWRHGWEIQAHGTVHENFNSTYTTRAQVHAAGAQMVAEIAAMLGPDADLDNLHFVYPQHGGNEWQDDVLRQYFASGRRSASAAIKPATSLGKWMRASEPIDDWPNGFDDAKKRLFRDIAETNGRMIFYSHTVLDHLEDMIRYALDLGITIAQPRHILYPGPSYTDRFFEDDAAWTLAANTSYDTTYKVDGTRSLKLALPNANNSPLVVSTGSKDIAAQRGFSVLRASFLYKAAVEVTRSTGAFGFGWRWLYWNISQGGNVVSGGAASMNLETTLPAANFDNKIERLIYIPQQVCKLQPQVQGVNIGGATEMWVDDFDIQKIYEVDAVTKTVAMTAGTTGYVWSGVLLVDVVVTVTPLFSPLGRLYVSYNESGKIIVRSTDATDAGNVMISFTHGGGMKA